MYFIDSRGTWGKKWYGQYRSDRTVSDAPGACVCVFNLSAYVLVHTPLLFWFALYPTHAALTLAYQEAPTAGQNVPMGLAVPSATVPAAIVWSSGIEGSGHQDIGNIASSPSNIDPASTTITVQLGTTGRRDDHKGNVPGGKKKGMSGRLIAVAVILPIMFIGK